MATKRNDKLTKSQLWNIIAKTENELDKVTKENEKLRKQVNDLNFANKKILSQIGTLENELLNTQDKVSEQKKVIEKYKKKTFLKWLFGRKD